MSKLHVHKNDTVVILSGKDKGKKGEIIRVIPKEGKVVVQGANIVTKHQKARKQGETGGIIKVEAPILACRVMNVCSKCGKASRSGRRKLNDGTKVRYCKKCDVEN